VLGWEIAVEFGDAGMQRDDIRDTCIWLRAPDRYLKDVWQWPGGQICFGLTQRTNLFRAAG
jgi:hypothetical protein